MVMKLRLLCTTVFFLLILPFAGNAQTKSQIRKTEKLFKNQGEIRFWFLLKKKDDIKELTRAISIDHVKGDTVHAFANKRGLLRFFELGYSRFQLIATPAQEYEKSLKKAKRKGPASVQAFDNYPTYPQYEQIMQQFATNHPAICKLVNLGTLPSGRKILALKITDSLSKQENEPQFLYTSSMHGDETAGYPLMLKLADELLNGYNVNPRLTQLVNQMEIWINPLANPDGTYRGGNNTVASATRFNASNVDLNRNYPDPQDGPHPDGEAYQSETKIFMAFADSMDFVMAANFHGGVEVANFPWDTWQIRPADEAWWTAECVRFADSARAQAPANYFTDVLGYPNLPGVTQGFDWYEVNGGRQDYMNWFHNCREFTVELSDTKLLPENQIANHWNYLRESLLGYMEASLRGFRGTITDLCTGKPIRARVKILNHDKDSSHVYSSSIRGNYHRPVAAGNWQVEFSAPGYQKVTLPAVSVFNNQQATVQNMGLQPLSPKALFSKKLTDICGREIRFTDLSGSAEQWRWDFGDGTTSTEQNPTHSFSQSGTYSVQLKVTNCAGSDSVLINNIVTINATDNPVLTGDTSICGAVPHTLTGISSAATVWYNSAAGGVALDTGNQFTTLPLVTSQTYYAQSIKPLTVPNIGPVSNTFGAGGFFVSNAYHYQIFDVRKSFVLKSVRVYANTTGNRTIQLRNSQGVVLMSKTVSIPQGSSRVTLDFQVPVGTSLQLGLAGGQTNNLYRNSAGASYPYSFDGIVQITGNSAGNPGFYYFFYDWEISARCESPRFPVIATVTNAPVPTVAASLVGGNICEGDTVRLLAVSGNSTNPEVKWFEGNGILGSGPQLKVILPAGNHSVYCTSFSSDTCAAINPAVSNQVNVTVNTRPAGPNIQLVNGILVSGSGPVTWLLNGQPISGMISDSLVPSVSGLYTALITIPGGCASLPSNAVVVTGMKEGQNQRFGIWYAENELFTENKTGKPVMISVYSSNGQMVLEKEIPMGTSRIPVKLLPSGRYLVKSAGIDFVPVSFLRN